MDRFVLGVQLFVKIINLPLTFNFSSFDLEKIEPIIFLHFLKSVKKNNIYYYYNMPYGYPSLTPMYGLGSYGRSGAATVISSPRTRIGSIGRIYAYYKARGQGQQYELYLINALGLKYLPRVNPYSYI
jgi:hypothetical protein